MSSVAEQLRGGREAKGLSIQHVADAIKMRGDHVIALEKGDYDVFAAPVYIRGFTRSYAQLLKLDVAEVMAQLDRELAQSDKHHEPPPLGPQSRGFVDAIMYQLSRVNWHITAPVIGLAVVIGGVYWGLRVTKTRQIRDPLAKLGPGLYEGAKIPDTLPLPVHR
jgi:cytoskeletal protein RodZ